MHEKTHFIEALLFSGALPYSYPLASVRILLTALWLFSLGSVAAICLAVFLLEKVIYILALIKS